MAFPHLLPSHIWAADTKPNSRLTMGFIGMGTQSRGAMLAAPVFFGFLFLQTKRKLTVIIAAAVIVGGHLALLGR